MDYNDVTQLTTLSIISDEGTWNGLVEIEEVDGSTDMHGNISLLDLEMSRHSGRSH